MVHYYAGGNFSGVEGILYRFRLLGIGGCQNLKARTKHVAHRSKLRVPQII